MAYATSEQLGNYLSDDQETPATVPADAARLLVRASELINDHIAAAVYDVDDDEQPTDAKIVTALVNATCAQVEHWLEGDEEDDVLGPTQGAAIGGMQQQYGAGENRVTPMYLAPRAARHLRRAGLLSGAVTSR
jgi:hypothetical protein